MLRSVKLHLVCMLCLAHVLLFCSFKVTTKLCFHVMPSVGQAEKLLSSELQQFQQRVQRCAMDCRDAAQMKLPTDPEKQTPSMVASLQSEVCNKVEQHNLIQHMIRHETKT